MIFHRRTYRLFAFALAVLSGTKLLSKLEFNQLPREELIIIGGGIAGGMEAYYGHVDAKKNNIPLCISMYERNKSIIETPVINIAPSLTCDEIVSVVPRGPEFVKKSEILFSKPGGIRVEDVAGIHGTAIAEQFKKEVQIYSLDEAGHAQRTHDLLALGKMSMDLWHAMYTSADVELKKILELSNYNPCCDPLHSSTKALHEGYRIDLIYNVPNAQNRVDGMKRDYEALGYKQCAILTPAEVATIDPFLKGFCDKHAHNNVWNNDTVALWRPGGCFDAQVFLPRLYEYLAQAMGTYTNAAGKQENRFQIHYGKNVSAIEFASNDSGKTIIAGLHFEDGQTVCNKHAQYVFCPGEAVGTLKKLGLSEPAYAGFAGVSLLLDIDIPHEKRAHYAKFSHCMEVHQEGIVLAWQARLKDNKIAIKVAGTKAFYSDQRPTKDQEFAKNRNLLQLNMINDVLPEFMSLALKRDTTGATLTEKDLLFLESHNIATRWAGVRSVVYDGFPSVGYVYKDGVRVENARCTTHLGSGGASFSHAATVISRNAMNAQQDEFTQRILKYGNSARAAAAL